MLLQGEEHDRLHCNPWQQLRKPGLIVSGGRKEGGHWATQIQFHSFVDDLVGILWFSKLYDGAGCCLDKRVPDQPFYAFDPLWYAWPIFLQYLISGLLEIGHIHRTVCNDAIGRDLCHSSAVNTVDSVICRLLQCFHLAAGSCLMPRSPLFFLILLIQAAVPYIVFPSNRFISWRALELFEG